MLRNCRMFCFFIFINLIIKFLDKFPVFTKINLAYYNILDNLFGINDKNWYETDKGCHPPIEINKVRQIINNINLDENPKVK